MTVTIEDLRVLQWSGLPVASLVESWRRLLDGELDRVHMVEDLAKDVELVTSELVTNAVQHGPCDERVWLRVQFSASWARVNVWDASNEPPKFGEVPSLDGDLNGDLDRDLATLATNGRGLRIVKSLATALGVDWTPPRGKWTWAAL